MKKALPILFLIVGALVWFFFGRNAENTETDSTYLSNEAEAVSSDVTEPTSEITELPEQAPLVASDPEISNVIPSFPIESLPLFFPQQLDQKLKQVIAEDLSIIYGDIESFDILKVDPALIVTSEGREYVLAKYIDFRGRGRYFPDEIKDIYIYENASGKQVFVSDETVEAYQIAESRRNAAPEVYGDLEDFLHMMNNLDEVSIQNPEERFYLYGEAQRYEKQMLETLTPKSFQNAYGRNRYRTPSLLEIKRGNEFDSLLQDLGNKFVAKVYVYDQANRISDGSPPFVYHEGKWKLLIVIPGT
jgi:hypothetical protein